MAKRIPRVAGHTNRLGEFAAFTGMGRLPASSPARRSVTPATLREIRRGSNAVGIADRRTHGVAQRPPRAPG
ncbi:hypothetical protein MSHI_34600 [Mycobacterium shinjukuense]|uniref:Uncharacterized protein n=1 Tax=Mycobacterium shinjukuense TaxID=398694 RepID=A0A7I7MTE1_9MYCO|nr:hypothetical protein MSHI_34600 [Mycobacterium shinjukuense]